MKTSDKLLALLSEHRGEYLSGEAAAESLGVSRTAVWKAVNALREKGVGIDAVTNKGYALSSPADILSESGIKNYLKGSAAAAALTVRESVTSTNLILKEMAQNGAPKGTVIIAGEQSAGRGRLGRSFFSPTGTGVYISVLLRPTLPAERATLITTAAAVCVCESVEALCPGATPQIKWVNDIFLGDKKVCGILTEAGFDLESGRLDYAVVGVGINVYKPEGGFPGEIQSVAGALLTERENDMRNRIAAHFLNRFFTVCQSPADCIDEYRKRSLVIGKKISVVSTASGKATPATALSVGEDCSLRVQYEDGSEESLRSGEISVRL